MLLALDGSVYLVDPDHERFASPEEPVSARRLSLSAAGEQRVGALTSREMEIAGLLVVRATNEEIADHLGISRHTARRHTERVMRKLRVATRNAVREVVLDRVHAALNSGSSMKLAGR